MLQRSFGSGLLLLFLSSSCFQLAFKGFNVSPGLGTQLGQLLGLGNASLNNMANELALLCLLETQ